MKNIKKLLSIVMMLALVLSLGANAFAATVTLPTQAQDHDMVAYQIFKGEQNAGQKAENPSDTMGITDWGANITAPNDFLTAMANAYPEAGFKSGMTAVEAAKIISDMSSGNNDAANVALGNAIAKAVQAQGVAGKKFEGNTADLENGYWVIVDETENLPNGESRSTVLLDVIGQNLTLEDKIAQPTLKKEAEGAPAVVEGLGATVTYTLTATLPSNFGDYESYFLAFHDDMSEGLTFVDVTSVVLTHGTETVSANRIGEGVETGYGLLLAADGSEHTFDVTLENVKAIFPTAAVGDTITVTYTATVNDKAVTRNENNATLEYNNDPSKNDKGETLPEKAVVFTFDLDGTKVEPNGEDEDGNPVYKPLEGASFTLYKTAEVGEDTTGKASVTYNGKTFYEYRAEVPATLNEDTGDYEFGFGQLGKGEYLLVETKVPEGYNKAGDIYFQIIDTTETAPDGTQTVTGAVVVDENGTTIVNGAEIDFDGTVDGTLDEQVINTSGLQLPETGGIGTTIFYVVGAVLVAGAVILLVTRKRMSGASK